MYAPSHTSRSSRIDLDEGDFSSHDDRGSCANRERINRGEDEAQENRFRFMDLDEFRLRLTGESSFLMAHRWIRRALTRRPMAVAIRCDAWSPHLSERLVFSFDKYCRGGGAYTCHLRALHLNKMTLQREFADVIAGELPVLEDLRLEVCRYSFSRIASTSLQNLAMYCCSNACFYASVLVFAAPRLATLRIHSDWQPVAAECEMTSLVAASLDNPDGIVALLGSLRHATNLSLHGLGSEEPAGGFPVFHNLRNLDLYNCDIGVDCQALRRFLRNAPSLETLALRHCSFTGGSRRKKRKARSSNKASSSGGRRVTASYLCKNLKSVELKYFDDQDVSELEDALEEILNKVVHTIESSVQYERRTVRISYE